MRFRLSVFLLVILSTLVVHICFSDIQEKDAVASPFFPEGGPVHDAFSGDLGPAREALTKHDVVLVLFYAQWAKQAQDARAEFVKAAEILAPLIPCHAVDCTISSGECKDAYTLYKYPILYAYVSGVSNAYYFQGPHTAEHYVYFAQSMVHPVTPLRSMSDVLTFSAQSDSTFIGYFNLTSQHLGKYLQFYLAGRRSLTKDYLHPIRFGVLSDPVLADKVALKAAGSVVLTRSMDTLLYYPPKANFTSSALVEWAYENRQKPLVSWVSPTGVKSVGLSSALSRGPVVLLLAQHNPLLGTNNQYYAMMREYALAYNACNRSESVRNDMTLYRMQSVRARRSAAASHQRLAAQCSRLRVRQKLQKAASKCINSVGQSENSGTKRRHWLNSSFEQCRGMGSSLKAATLPSISAGVSDGDLTLGNVCPITLSSESVLGVSVTEGHGKEASASPRSGAGHGPGLSSRMDHSDLFAAWHQVEKTPAHTNVDGVMKSRETLDSCTSNPKECASAGKPGSVRHRRVTDPWVASAESRAVERACAEARLAHEAGYRQESSLETGSHSSLLGGACATNQSLAFLAVDTHQMPAFLGRFGLSALSDQSGEKLACDPVRVVILSQSDDSFYTLKEGQGAAAVGDLIMQFHNGSLQRDALSLKSDSKSTQNECADEFCIIEVTAENFNEVVLNSTQDVLLYYYSPSCGQCKMMSHRYLTLYKYFKRSRQLVLARINGEANDLPWEYQSGSYPSFILYPALGKADSVVFPLSKKSPSVYHLSWFILRHSTYDHDIRQGHRTFLTDEGDKGGVIGRPNSLRGRSRPMCYGKVQRLRLLSIIEKMQARLRRIDLEVQAIGEKLKRLESEREEFNDITDDGHACHGAEENCTSRAEVSGLTNATAQNHTSATRPHIDRVVQVSKLYLQERSLERRAKLEDVELARGLYRTMQRADRGASAQSRTSARLLVSLYSRLGWVSRSQKYLFVC